MNEKSEQEQLFLLARDALQDTLRHQERRTALLWRLFLSDMRYYALFALISIPILILLSSASQSGMTFFWFALLGLFGLYEIYRQKYLGMDELIKTCWMNSGRCYLYKSALCALTQAALFTLLLMLEQNSEEAHYLWLIMNTLLPALCAQLAALIIDRFIANAVQVFLLHSYPVIRSMLSLPLVIMICLCLGSVDVLLTLLHGRTTQKGACSWN